MPTAVLRRAPGAPPITTRSVRRRGDKMLAELGLGGAELSVLLTDDEEIRKLNAAYRRTNRPTDVLAFASDQPAYAGPRVLGDVVISLETARRQAASRRRSLLDEVTFLLAHGVLHLVGLDHGTRRELRRMRSETLRLETAARGRAAAGGRKPRGGVAAPPRPRSRQARQRTTRSHPLRKGIRDRA